MSQPILRPIWTPEDARQLAQRAAEHPTELGIPDSAARRPLAAVRGFFADGLHWLALVGFILGAALYYSAAPAHADTVNETAYLMAITEQGIEFPDAASAIGAGHEVCDYLASGRTPKQASRWVHDLGHLDWENSGFIVGAAAQAFCPWQLPGGTTVA